MLGNCILEAIASNELVRDAAMKSTDPRLA